MMTNKNVLIKKPETAEVIEQSIPEIAANEVLIKVMASGICGTDVHIYKGSYMGQYPVVPGHEFSGVVEKVGVDVVRIKEGDRVAVEPNIACDNCWYCLHNEQNFCENWQAIGVTLPGGMAQYVKAPEKAVFDIGPIPFSAGAFMEPLSCVLHGIEKLEISPGQRVLIIGAGPIGILLLQMVQIEGSAEVAVIDTNTKRTEFAEKFGASAIYSTLEQAGDAAFDAVIDATGVPEVMGKSVHFARKGGKVLLFGVPPMGKHIELDSFQLFQKGLCICSSFTSVRNSYQAIALLQSGRVKAVDLVSHTLPLESFAEGIELVMSKNIFSMKIIIEPNSSR